MNRICKLFNIKYPIIQGGMIWCSGWRLASAVSNNGGLGLIGAGSMYPEILEEHIIKCKEATNKPFGVNLPLLYPETEKIIEIIEKHDIKIVFTSAGSPKKYTKRFHENGIKVAHVVANSINARKCEEAGVDAVVAEGFEAGGHNGREETTTMVLIPKVKSEISIPLVAAGGIGTGRTMLSAMVLGADGVQIGSKFAASVESSAHENFKNAIINAKEGDTLLTLKKLIPVRLIKNMFFDKVEELQNKGADNEELQNLLGKGRAKKGMFEGDIEEGELEIGQISSMISEIKSVKDIFDEILNDFYLAKNEVIKFDF